MSGANQLSSADFNDFENANWEQDALFAENWDTADAANNVLLYPHVAPGNVRHDVLAALRGGLVTDASLRARVSVILGPGSTLLGIAGRLHPLYVAAATASHAAPTINQLAQAILVYSRYYIPVPSMRNYADGLRIPLPIEIDRANGDWILNSNLVRTWSRSFQAAWHPLPGQRPARLQQPDPVALQAQVQTFLRAQPTALARGIHFNARVLSNPFEAVFFVFETLRHLPVAEVFALTLAFLDQSVNHQMKLLASLTAGNAILRQLLSVLHNPPAALTARQTASRNRGERMLQGALQPAGIRSVPRELPETPQQLANRPGNLGWQRIEPTDPVVGRHRMVLGRDVLAGAVLNFNSGGNTYRGPAYGGRIPPAAFIRTHANLLNPAADARIAARLQIVQAIVVNEGFLDAVRLRDRAILSLGIQQSSAHVDIELPALLARYKNMAPDEFRLFFEIYNLDLRANGNDGHGNPRFRLQRIQPNGARVDLTTWAARRNFFGGRTVGTTTTFTTDWAARCREPAIASLKYRAAQVLEAASRLDRILREVGNITVAGAPMALSTLITSQQGVALILDAHINQPGRVPADLQAAANAAGAQPDANALDQEITRQYALIRHTHNTPARNANINALGLDVNHGTFAGW
ncbi:MAG: hypothetical protein OQK98_06665 [Gammaproteobacteria bacterium]|nr:hypothetical protein [Gammaproteobacteria bacterium]